jgi:two-component system, OmpR family, sensor kinase
LSLRSRLVLASSGLTIVSLGIGFALVFVAVTRTHHLHLDRVLVTEAAKEADQIAKLGLQDVELAEGPGPIVSGIGPLTKYAALFARDGTLLEKTSAFPSQAHVLGDHVQGSCFDVRIGTELVRGAVAPVPGGSGARLFLGVPRWDIDDDAVLLARAMVVAFLIAATWSIFVANWVVRRLTRAHSDIADVLRRVAAGDLAARVRTDTSDAEVARLSADVNDMVKRLEILLASQQRFITHAAHELRSPLTTLYGELSYALAKGRRPEDYKKTVEEAFDSARRLKHLVEDLLSLAKAGSRANSEVDLRLFTLLEEAIAQIRWEADQSGVVFSLDDSNISVRGDDAALMRMFRNVLENAVHYAPRSTAVTIACQRDEASVIVDVSDRGPGIPRAEAEDVFAPFFRGRVAQSDDARLGAGLGLAIAREIARAHGGDLVVAPTTDGATFRFRLPLPDETRPSHDAASTRPATNFKYLPSG